MLCYSILHEVREILDEDEVFACGRCFHRTTPTLSQLPKFYVSQPCMGVVR
jgi:hypothetical protein